MSQGRDPSVVHAWYKNPATGKTEVYELPSIVYEEASRGRWVENTFVVPHDADAWSQEQPEGVAPADIIDHRPKPMESLTRPAQPPPALPTRSPEPLRGREREGVPPVPTRRRV
jgi:hypothetical protein